MKKIVITAGGTSEPIDTVRSITNSSTGRLGCEICAALLKQKSAEIEKIFYLCPLRAVRPPESPLVEVVTTGGTASLLETVKSLLTENRIDIFIHSMAVSDYTVDYVSSVSLLSLEISEKLKERGQAGDTRALIEETIRNNGAVLTGNKISSDEKNLIIKLKPTPKVISAIKPLSPGTFLVGFKLLSGVPEEELRRVGMNLLQKNRCDLVVANDLANISGERHKALLLRPDGSFLRAETKAEIANLIISEAFGRD
ncbi:MAG: phosphopantothenoylcysteine decarboxylase [Oscillospiraceae bacterium]|jgi:phosphopantothenate--cysteine ligase